MANKGFISANGISYTVWTNATNKTFSIPARVYVTLTPSPDDPPALLCVLYFSNDLSKLAVLTVNAGDNQDLPLQISGPNWTSSSYNGTPAYYNVNVNSAQIEIDGG